MKQLSRTAAQTRQNLIDAYWRLYKEKGDKVTVKDVAALAGYHRGVFYDYFTNTEEILQEIENNLIEHVQHYAIGFAATASLTLGLLHNVQKLYNEKGEYLCVLLSDKGDPRFLQRYRKTVKLSIANIVGIDYENNLSIDIALEQSITGAIQAFTYWYPRRDQLPSQDFALLLFFYAASRFHRYLA